MFAIFDTLDIFNQWHNQINAKYGFPKSGENLATGEIESLGETQNFTHALLNPNDSRVIAYVGDETEGLSLIDFTSEQYAGWKKVLL